MRRILIAAVLVLAACSPTFDPASKIEKLRVVAVKAEPPEIDPAGIQTADLTSLVLRADYLTTTRTATVVHLACVPVPGSLDLTPCVMLSNLTDPAVKIAAVARAACAQEASGDPSAATTTWAPIALVGFEACADAVCGSATTSGGPLPAPQVTIPAGFTFAPAEPAQLGAGDTVDAWRRRVAEQRILGVQAVDLAFAIDALPDELVAGVGAACPAGDIADRLAALWAAREHVLTVKRVPIRGPDSPNPANRNPSVAEIVAGGTTLDPAAATTVAGGVIDLTPLLPAGAAGEPEVYVELDAAGVPIQTKTEEWVYSWFSTAGDLADLHTRSATKADAWTVRSAGPARVAVVVRDLRGGTAWVVRDVVVSGAPPPPIDSSPWGR
jgi:hypothetical protein